MTPPDRPQGAVELHQFPSDWTLPNPSPFCLKVETWLRMADIPYAVKAWSPMAAPMGKAPFVVVQGEAIADSSTIVRVLTDRFDVTVDHDLDDHARATATLVQRLMEEHLYWALMTNRWVDPAGWRVYQPIIARSMPGPVPSLLAWWARRSAVRAAHSQGLARHPLAEVRRRGIDDLDAVARVLGDQPYLLGDAPRSIDATGYAFLAQLQQPEWADELSTYAREHPQLSAYTERMRKRYW